MKPKKLKINSFDISNLRIKYKKYNYSPVYNHKRNIIEMRIIDYLKIEIKVKKSSYIPNLKEIEEAKETFRERHKSEMLKSK